MKIAIVTFAAYGAGAQYTAQLANALSVESKVCVLLPAAADTGRFTQHVCLIRLPLPFTLAPAASTALSQRFMKLFLDALDREKPDVVHLVFEHRFPFFYACRLNRKYPLVTTIHEPRAIPNRGRAANLLAASLQYINNSFLARCSDEIIIHSEGLRNTRLISSLPAGKVRVVPIGSFSFSSLHTLQPEKAGKNVLFFGRIAAYKGLEYLIEAAKMVRPSVPGLTVTIAGEGDLSKYAAAICDSGFFLVHNRFIPEDEAAGLFHEADLVVLPYTDGTQTLLISLAGTSKKPVVVTDVGNFAEMVEDGSTGLVIPPKDSRSLAEAMLKLLNNDELRINMGENAFSKMKGGEYSWDKIAARTTAIYSEAMAVHSAKNRRA